MKRKFISLLLALTLVITSVPHNAFANAGESTNLNKYSGEELLKGIFFGVGDAARELENIWTEETYELNNSESAIMRVEMLVKEIKKIDPTYLDRLEESIYSNNYLELEKIFQELNGLLEKSVANIVERQNIVIEKNASIEDPGVGTNSVAALGAFVYLGAAVTTVGAVTHAGVATAYLAVAGYQYVWGGKEFWGPNSSSASQSTLGKEEVIDTVITSYN